MAQGFIDVTLPRDQRGFTIIEVMIVVVILAVLAAIAVPQFFKSSSKAKALSEVSAIFAELATREEQYKSDNNRYVTIAECPTTTTTTGVASTVCMATADWITARLNPAMETLRCKYEVVAGLATDTATNPGGFTFASPTTMGWYYALATCDSDNNAGTNATFFISSVSSQIQKLNEGQ